MFLYPLNKCGWMGLYNFVKRVCVRYLLGVIITLRDSIYSLHVVAINVYYYILVG